MIYGANGYTGRLGVRYARTRSQPGLAGRRSERIRLPDFAAVTRSGRPEIIERQTTEAITEERVLGPFRQPAD
jgi:short subunit dehydrogenase-like uncharacterized protein